MANTFEIIENWTFYKRKKELRKMTDSGYL